MEKNRNIAGIVTPYGLFNYGNRLQAYAVQEILKSLGVFPEEIIFPGVNKQTGIKQALKPLLFGKLNKSKQAARFRSFREFDGKINKRFFNSEDKISDFGYDYAIIGGDQIWNPNSIIPSPAVFGKFVQPSKRICVSPSFGVEQIDGAVAKAFADGLRDLGYLSVREEAGRRIIQQLIGRDAEVLPDPTMALSKEEWSRQGRSDYVPDGSYVFTYFLSKDAGQYKSKVDALSRKRGLAVVDIMDREGPYYGAGPQDFVSLIENSSLVCTDSFHAAVFSIIFSRPFVVYSRIIPNSMNSRIETLSATFGMTMNLDQCELLNITSETIAEKQINDKISLLRERLITYLNSCFRL